MSDANINIKVQGQVSKNELMNKIKQELDNEFKTDVVDRDTNLHVSVVNFKVAHEQSK